MKKIKVLIIGSDLNVKGGMVSVIKNYLEYSKWKISELEYIPCYVEKGFFQMMIYYFRSLFKIRNYLKKNPVDIVHLHMAERGSFYRKAKILNLCKRYKKKVIIHHHAAEFHSFYQQSNFLIKKYIRKILYKADLNIVLSNRLIGMIHDINDKAKVKVLYNAVKTYENNQYNPLSNEVLFLGRLGERKGIYDLLKVIKKLDERLPEEIKFNLCGDGEIENVKSLSRKYGIEQRLGHVGWIDATKKEEILRRTIINVLPSYNEGLPMSILETMAYGIPNVSTKIASIPEVIIHENNGYLIEPGNLEDLEFYIEKLVMNHELRKTMSKEGYRIIKQKFTMEKHIDQLEQYYKKVMKNEY